MILIYVISVFVRPLQWGLQIPLPQQKLASVQCAPPPGPAVSLRRWSPVGERHRDVDPVGWWLCKDRLEGLPQDPERGRPGTRDAVGFLQGWTLVQRKCSCGDAAGQRGREVRETDAGGGREWLSLHSVLKLTCSAFFKRSIFFFSLHFRSEVTT